MSEVTKFGKRRKKEKEEETGVSLSFINENYINVDGSSTMIGPLNMGGNSIKNLSDPKDLNDAVNKNYIDTISGHQILKKDENGDFIVTENLKMNGNKIQGLPLPVHENDAVNIKYFMENSGFIRKNGGFEAQDNIYLKNKKIGGLREPKANGEATNKKYVDDEIKELKENTLNKFVDGLNYKLDANMDLNSFRVFNVPTPQREDEAANKKYIDEKTKNLNGGGGGGSLEELTKLREDLEKNQAFNTRNEKTFNAKGNLNMKQKTIRNIPEPTQEDDVVNKKYIDERTPFIKENGYYQSTAGLNMGFNKILNLPIPKNDEEATNKRYVDYTLKDIVKQETEKEVKKELKKEVVIEFKNVEEKNKDFLNQQIQEIERYKTFIDQKIENIKESLKNENEKNKERIF